MKALAHALMVMGILTFSVPVFAAGEEHECPEGEVWSETEQRCVPEVEEEGVW